MSNTTMTPVEAPQKENKGSARLLSLLLIAACVAVFFLPIAAFTSAWTIAEQSLLETLKALFSSKEKLFGFLPALVGGNETLAMVANLMLYVFLLAVVATAILSIIGLISGKKGLVCTASFLLTWGAILYALNVYCVSAHATGLKATFDLYTFALVAACLLVQFIVLLAKKGKGAYLPALQFVLSAAVIGLILFAIMKDGGFEAIATKATAMKWVCLVICILLLLNLIVTYCRVSEGVFRCALSCVLVAVLTVVYFLKGLGASKIFIVIALCIAIIQLIIAVLSRPKEVEAVTAEVIDFQTEEYVEAYAYEGGPVAGVQLAEEVNPTVSAIDASRDPDGAARASVASLLGNGFDPFLITLSTREKEEFIDLYVLKCKGFMPEIPGYVVGGDNKEFFNCVFIYLGQYREKIPADLLEKMYKFSMKLS